MKNSLEMGYWLDTGCVYPGQYKDIDVWECSVCYATSLEKGVYCPNCGIRMIEDNDERREKKHGKD